MNKNLLTFVSLIGFLGGAVGKSPVHAQVPAKKIPATQKSATRTKKAAVTPRVKKAVASPAPSSVSRAQQSLQIQFSNPGRPLPQVDPAFDWSPTEPAGGPARKVFAERVARYIGRLTDGFLQVFGDGSKRPGLYSSIRKDKAALCYVLPDIISETIRIETNVDQLGNSIVVDRFLSPKSQEFYQESLKVAQIRNLAYGQRQGFSGLRQVEALSLYCVPGRPNFQALRAQGFQDRLMPKSLTGYFGGIEVLEQAVSRGSQALKAPASNDAVRASALRIARTLSQIRTDLLAYSRSLK